MSSKLIRKRFLFIIGPVLIGLSIWQVLVWATGVPPFILPSPWRVARALIDNAELILGHTGVTALEVGLGLVFGTGLGAMFAMILMMMPRLRHMAMPLLVFSQAVPVFALAPLLTLWFGYGYGSKVVMAMLIIFFPVTSTFLDGLRRTDPGILDLAATMGASRWSSLWRLRVPAALPSLASGLRLAAVYAPIGAVIGEWVGASQGLGYLMLLANGRAKADLMFAALIVLASLTMLLHAAIGALANRLATYAGSVASDPADTRAG